MLKLISLISSVVPTSNTVEDQVKSVAVTETKVPQTSVLSSILHKKHLKIKKSVYETIY